MDAQPRGIIFRLRGAKLFYIRSYSGVGLIATPIFPLRLEVLNILPKHLRRHALDGERLARRVARCVYTSNAQCYADFRSSPPM